MSIYNADGKINVTQVDGSTYVGAYAVDGSLNVVLDDEGGLGVIHPSGALRVSTEEGLTYYDPTGAVYFNRLFGVGIDPDDLGPADVVSEPTWSPADLFATTEDGGWYTIDPAYLYVGRTGTVTPEVGDPVGQILDRSGGGYTLVAVSDSDRFILRQDSIGNYYLEGNGTRLGYELESATAWNWTKATACFVMTPITLGGWQTIFGKPQATGSHSSPFFRWGMLFDNTKLHIRQHPNVVDTAVNTVANGVQVLLTYDSETLTLRKDQMLVADGTDTATLTYDNDVKFRLGSNGGGGEAANIRIYDMVFRDTPFTADERALVEGYMLAKYVYADPVATVLGNPEGFKLRHQLPTQYVWEIDGGADGSKAEIASDVILRWASDGVKSFGSDNSYVVRVRGSIAGEILLTKTLNIAVSNLNADAPKDIGLDLDIATDIDDFVGLCVAIQAHKRGDANLLFVNVSSDIDSAAGCVRAVLDHHGLTGIPVGAYQGRLASSPHLDNYTGAVRDRFGTPGQSRTQFPDDVSFLRGIISQASRPITIAAGGGFTSLSRFRQSGADAISALTGDQIITANVEQMVVMAGATFPDSSITDYNMTVDAPTSQDIAANWPSPVIWHDVTIASGVQGRPPAASTEFDFPLKHGFVEWGVDVEQECWDPLAVHYAIYGPRTAYSMGGANGSVDPTQAGLGFGDWSASAGNDSYVAKEAADATLAAEINEMIEDLYLGEVPTLVESGAGNHYWQGIAIGTNKMVASQYLADDGVSKGKLYTSTNRGVTWTENVAAGQRFYSSVAITPNDQIIYATSYKEAGTEDGAVIKSTDGGATWSTLTVDGGADHRWETVATSADGQVVVLCEYSPANFALMGSAWLSTDGGATFTQILDAQHWHNAAISADGTKIAVVSFTNAPAGAGVPGEIHISTNSGATFAQAAGDPGDRYQKVAMNSDGTVLAVAGWLQDDGTTESNVYLSTNFGTTFTTVTELGSQRWAALAISPNGERIIAGSSIDSGGYGTVYETRNGGDTWPEFTQHRLTYFFQAAFSADNSLAAVVLYDNVDRGKILLREYP